MRRRQSIRVMVLALGVSVVPSVARAQATVTAAVSRKPSNKSEHGARPLPPAVLWLVPLQPVPAPATEAAHPPYILLQRDRTFTPHILVVPVGTAVNFPNADPFFHNVFSLYNGKRFDLGLYEKGTSRQVVFSREGVSYIFCNIHPEMSAVVLALQTPWWARSYSNGELKIENVHPGPYEAHLWVEGVDPRQLEHWTHRVEVGNGFQNAGTLTVNPDALPLGHANMFGQPYAPEIKPY